MAGVIRRRAATAVAATIRASPPAVATTVPAFGSARKFSAVATRRLPAAATTTKATLRLSSATATVKSSVRKFAALATPRLPAAAAATTTTTALRLSSAAATMRAPIRFAAPLRHTHTAALPEALEARIKQLEADLDNKILLLRAELHKGSVEACEKVEKGVFEAYRKLEKAHLQAYDSYLHGLARQDQRIGNLSDLIMAECRRGLHRAAKANTESARAVNEVGKVSWRVVVTVVGAAATTGFATAQLLKADTTTRQEEIADERIRVRIAQVQEDFTKKLEGTVEKAVEVALAKEARRKSVADEDALHSFTARLEDAIDRAVEAALAKQALEKNKVQSGQGGGDGPPST